MYLETVRLDHGRLVHIKMRYSTSTVDTTFYNLHGLRLKRNNNPATQKKITKEKPHQSPIRIKKKGPDMKKEWSNRITKKK